MNGVIVVNKPQEFTSFDVVAVMRRLCGQRKIGHTGTLDPMAEGVLPLLLGTATRAQDILPDSDKEYIAGFSLGMTTDTLDIWGEERSRSSRRVTRDELLALIPEFTGGISQLPPMYSAVKKNGVRLYDLARQGAVVEREPRNVTITELELLSYDEESRSGRLRVLCSKGTYIRSLIDDIGARLGAGGVMTSLVRTKACGFTLEDARTLGEIRSLSEEGEKSENTRALLRSVESLFTAYDRLSVSDKQAVRFRNGNPLDLAKTELRSGAREGQILRVCSRSGEFIALGRVEGGSVQVFKMFWQKES